MTSDSSPSEISWADFTKVQIHTGTVLEARRNEKARAPAYVMKIDFGELGIKTSSAQITKNYAPEDLIGKQVVAVTNFPPKRIAGTKSEVLVLGAICDDHDIVLLEPTFRVKDGLRIG
ncbi:MAG: tRNA-binding protein [Gammaproteobacteria bacterium]|nr:tRNA-binding protein [Gammaproteobacteria bacterium]MDH3411531.1 tRNA-binding protein [Gammaproteobacteria bacterium]